MDGGQDASVCTAGTSKELLTAAACPCMVGPVTGWPESVPSDLVVNEAFSVIPHFMPSVDTDAFVGPARVMSSPPLCAGTGSMVAVRVPNATFAGRASRPATY